MPNKHACTFISGKVCPLTWIEPKRQTLPKINMHARLFGASEYLQTDKGVLRTVHNWNIFSTAARQVHLSEIQFCQHLIFSWKITYLQIKTKVLEKIKSNRLLAHSTPTAISHFTVISRKCYKVWQEWKGELRNVDHRSFYIQRLHYRRDKWCKNYEILLNMVYQDPTETKIKIH